MQNRKPAWWQLWMLVPLMFVLMALEHVTPLPGVSDGIVDTGILILTFVGMMAWVHLNGGLLERYGADRDEALQNLKITVYEPAVKNDADQVDPPAATPAAIVRERIALGERLADEYEESETWFLN